MVSTGENVFIIFTAATETTGVAVAFSATISVAGTWCSYSLSESTMKEGQKDY